MLVFSLNFYKSCVTHCFLERTSFIKAQYNRLLDKGKSKMQAVIASAHKLLRLAFGVLKSGKMFDDSYVRVYVKN